MPMNYNHLHNVQVIKDRSKYIDKYHREIEEGNYFGTFGTYTLATLTHRIGCLKTPSDKTVHMTLPDIYTNEDSLTYEWREAELLI